MNAAAVGTEVEAKFEIADPATLHAIASRSEIGPFLLRPKGRDRLHSIYLDTRSFVLARDGIAVRLRRCNNRWEATLKWRGEIDGDFHVRPELNLALPRPPEIPFAPSDGPLALYLTPWLAGRKLTARFVTDIVRQKLEVVCIDRESDGPLAEIALDTIEIRRQPGGVALATYCELELEQLVGSHDEVRAAAAALAEEFGLKPSRDTKFGRAFSLLFPRVEIAAEPRTSIEPGEPALAVLRRIVTVELRALRQAQPGTRLGHDPKPLHDLRVALRRLRAALWCFDSVLPSEIESVLNGDLQWLADSVAPLRDLDVELKRLDRSLVHAPESMHGTIQEFRHRLLEQRESAREKMLDAFDSRRHRQLLLALERLSQNQSKQADDVPIAVVATKAVRKAFKRARREAKENHAAEPIAMHELRIRVKRLRYLIEFFAPLIGKPAARVRRDLTRIQDSLGAYHDAMVATERIQAHAGSLDSEGGAQRLITLGALVGIEMQLAQQSREEFARLWRRFTKGKRRRHIDDSMARLEDLAQQSKKESAKAE